MLNATERGLEVGRPTGEKRVHAHGRCMSTGPLINYVPANQAGWVDACARCKETDPVERVTPSKGRRDCWTTLDLSHDRHPGAPSMSETLRGWIDKAMPVDVRFGHATSPSAIINKILLLISPRNG